MAAQDGLPRRATTNVLPAGYAPRAAFNLMRPAAMIGLSVASLALMPICAWLFLRVTTLLRPGLGLNDILGFRTTPRPEGGFAHTFESGWMVGVVLALVLIIPLHELVHGLGFWIFTRARPRFGWKLIYAYAAAPGWFLPRGPYLSVVLAPLVAISLAGTALLAVVPPAAVTAVLMLLIVNASAAVGDLAMAGWLLAQPRAALVEDTENGCTAYIRAESPPPYAANVGATPPLG
jgi:hypothetical protein